MDKSRSSNINPEEILGVVYRIQREDHHQSRTNDKGNIESLYELLCSAEQNHIGIQQQVGHTTLLSRDSRCIPHFFMGLN